MKSGSNMFYLFVGALGLLLLGVSLGFFVGKKDTVNWLRDYYSLRYSTSDVSLNLLGANFNLVVDRGDRTSAWKIYNQIQTRIGSVEFNEDYDSFLHVNKSLHELFKFTREELANVPVEKLSRDKNLVEFYHKILNAGIRPYLSKWHIPVSHYHESNKDSGKSVLELERNFPKREEILKDMKALNSRLKDVSSKLKEIIEAK